MKQEVKHPCPECKVGNLQVKAAFLFQVQDRQPICIPDFPAWVCDFCGWREYDSTALAELYAMLGTDRRSRRKARRSRTIADLDHPPTSADPQRRQ